MKKIFTILLLIAVLASCSKTEEKNTNWLVENKNLCETPYVVWSIDKTNLKLKWVVISDDVINITSPMAWTIEYLNCTAGRKVDSNTLIARIAPDYNNPNIVNLSIQKWSLINQRTNIESLKSTTISNFDNQINDTKQQIKLLEKNIELTKKSGNLSKKDLTKQIQALNETLSSLEDNLVLLINWKKDALDKIDISEKALFTNIANITWDNLLKVDEIFWITEDNKDKNDAYEDFLSAKNRKLLLEVEQNFIKLNDLNKKLDNLNNQEISDYLQWILNLNESARDAIKESLVNIRLPQSQIDAFYNIFLTYTNNISDLKNSWDSLENSRLSVITSYDTQISSLEWQIKTTKTNLENLQTNKSWSVDTTLELQLSWLESQLKSLNTNLDNLISTKKSQVISLDNQILQLNQSIASLNSSLAVRNVYSGVNWIVKQKSASVWNNIWAWMSLCQIIPNAKSTKIKIYSPVELNIWDKLTFDFNWEPYEIIVENALVYKDVITQNFVYESNYLDRKYFKDWEIIELSLENNKEANINMSEKTWIIKVPVSYVKNKIDWNYIKVLSGSTVVDKKIILGDINWNLVEIKWWIWNITEICK